VIVFNLAKNAGTSVEQIKRRYLLMLRAMSHCKITSDFLPQCEIPDQGKSSAYFDQGQCKSLRY
jgi:hypothetical protein